MREYVAGHQEPVQGRMRGGHGTSTACGDGKSVSDLLGLQQAAGNRAVTSLLRSETEPMPAFGPMSRVLGRVLPPTGGRLARSPEVPELHLYFRRIDQALTDLGAGNDPERASVRRQLHDLRQEVLQEQSGVLRQPVQQRRSAGQAAASRLRETIEVQLVEAEINALELATRSQPARTPVESPAARPRGGPGVGRPSPSRQVPADRTFPLYRYTNQPNRPITRGAWWTTAEARYQGQVGQGTGVPDPGTHRQVILVTEGEFWRQFTEQRRAGQVVGRRSLDQSYREFECTVDIDMSRVSTTALEPHPRGPLAPAVATAGPLTAEPAQGGVIARPGSEAVRPAPVSTPASRPSPTATMPPPLRPTYQATEVPPPRGAQTPGRAEVPRPIEPVAPSPRAPQGGAGTGGHGLRAAGNVAVGIVAGQVWNQHLANEAARYGYVPADGPMGSGRLTRIAHMVIEWVVLGSPGGVPAGGARFNVTVWRQRIRESTSDLAPSSSVRIGWDAPAYRPLTCSWDVPTQRVTVTYDRRRDSRWYVRWGVENWYEGFITPDLNYILSDAPDAAVVDYLARCAGPRRPPCAPWA